MFDILIYIAIAIFLLGLFIIVMPRLPSRRRISRQKNKDYQRIISKIFSSRKSPKEKIIDIDIVLHKILLDLNFKGTLGEILKQSPEYINNLNKIWELHKIRNDLVHNLDNDYSEKFLHKKLEEFVKEVRILLKNI